MISPPSNYLIEIIDNLLSAMISTVSNYPIGIIDDHFCCFFELDMI
jgi:hypothetical protein